MKTEVQSIIADLGNTLDGAPWFGRPVYALLREVDDSIAFKRPVTGSHSLIDLLYHMLTWSQFSLDRLSKAKIDDMNAFDKTDWREIDPEIHNWDEGLAELIATHQQIIAILQTKDDAFLNEPVEYRSYDFRYLLKGLVQHNIYHAGQVAFLKKLLAA